MSSAGVTREHAHHFKSADDEFQASKFGMWVFLATELLMFGGLFMFYTVNRVLHPEMYQAASQYLDTTMGAVNTVVLISSSLTMALAIWAAQTNKQKLITPLLLVTLICAGIFMVIKYFEYTHKFDLGIFPGKFFDPEMNLGFETMPLFFSVYFMMTGLHGIHVTIGMGVIIWLIVRANRGDFGPEYYTPVEVTGLYWHLVDLIWIFLFPLLYLI